MAVGGALGTTARAMNAHSHAMNTIGGNIANINTTSYKEVATQYQDLRVGRALGGGFLSVNTVDVRRTEAQGPIMPTGRRLDVAINGSGFFVTSDPTQPEEIHYTRDGSFTGAAYAREGDADGDGSPDQGAHLLSSNGDYVLGYRADDSGGFGTTLEPIEYSNNLLDPGRATSRIAVRGNIPNNPALPTTHSVGVQVVRQLGTKTETNDVRIHFTPDRAQKNAWTVGVDTSGATIADVTITPEVLQFTGEGVLASDTGPAVATMVISYADGTTQQATVDLSELTQYSGGGQGMFVQDITQDGLEAGRLEEVAFNAQGVLMGRFSSNHEKPLYQLPLAIFPAQSKLAAIGNNSFQQTVSSGEPQLTQLKPDDRGTQILEGNLEQSAVVVEKQFSRMIMTQRAYSTAATAFRTSDEMLREVRNLKA